jgi:hypothetical protein
MTTKWSKLPCLADERAGCLCLLISHHRCSGLYRENFLIHGLVHSKRHTSIDKRSEPLIIRLATLERQEIGNPNPIGQVAFGHRHYSTASSH